MLPPFYGTLTQYQKYNRPNNQLRLMCMDGLVKPFFFLGRLRPGMYKVVFVGIINLQSLLLHNPTLGKHIREMYTP